MAAYAAGACPIVITDLSESRLSFAKSLVPSVRTVLVKRGSTPQELGNQIKALAGLPGGLSRAIECTGVESSIQACVYVSPLSIYSCRLVLTCCSDAILNNEVSQIWFNNTGHRIREGHGFVAGGVYVSEGD